MTVLFFAQSCRRTPRAVLPPKQPGCERVLPRASSLPARPAPGWEGGFFPRHDGPDTATPPAIPSAGGLWRTMMERWLDGAEPALCRPAAANGQAHRQAVASISIFMRGSARGQVTRVRAGQASAK